MGDIKEITGKLIGIEMEVEILSQDIESLSEDIVKLNALEDTLDYNIQFLKKTNVIAIHSEYRKSINELKAVRKSIDDFAKKKKKLEDKLEKLDAEYKICLEHYEKEYERTINNQNILTLFKEGKE